MESKGLNLSPESQVDALREFQRNYELDLAFPRMDLDEYVEIISNAEEKKTQISKSKEWSKFEPTEILRKTTPEDIYQSSTYRILKNLHDNSNEIFRYIGGYVPAPYTLISLILDLQTASELVIFDPQYLKSLVDFSVPVIKQYTKLISQFVDTLFILAPSECTIMKNSYIDIVQDSMNDIIHYCVSELNKPTLIHFCANKVSQVVNEDVVEPMKKAGIIGLNIPNIVESMDLAKKYNLILCGGIHPVEIQVETEQKMLNELKELIQKTKDIKYIFATNCQVKWAPGQKSSEELNLLFKKIRNLLKK
jgi:uroporphyrinogen-III decarboxylase